MAAYFIAQYVVNDPKLYREYQGGAAATIQAAGGEVVAFDVAAETIEGKPPGTIHIAVHDGTRAEPMSYTFNQGRVGNKRRAVTFALFLLRRSLLAQDAASG